MGSNVSFITSRVLQNGVKCSLYYIKSFTEWGQMFSLLHQEFYRMGSNVHFVIKQDYVVEDLCTANFQKGTHRRIVRVKCVSFCIGI
jgi:hypothetical protein